MVLRSVEMRKRKAAVVKARHAMLATTAGKTGGGTAQTGAGAAASVAGALDAHCKSAGTASCMQHSEATMLRECLPPPAGEAVAGHAAAGSPPRESIPGPSDLSAPAHVDLPGTHATTAAPAARKGQYPTECIPGSATTSNAAAYTGPTEQPTPECSSSSPAPLLVNPSMPGQHAARPRQRAPLFVHEVVGASGAKKNAVASYTPGGLQLGELFEVGEYCRDNM